MLYFTTDFCEVFVKSKRNLLIFLSCLLPALYISCSDEAAGPVQEMQDDLAITDTGYDISFSDLQNDSDNPADVVDTTDEIYSDITDDAQTGDTAEISDISDITDSGLIRSPQLVNNKDYLPFLKNIIQNARDNIIILHQEFLTGSTLDQLQNDLIAAKKRGVNIKILLEKDVEENAQRVNTLRSNGIDAALDSSSKTLHLKLVLSDNSHLLLGSTNFSYSSFQYNNEVNIYVNDTETVSRFYDYANSVLSDNGKLSKIYCTNCEFTPIGDGQYADIVVPVINNAKKNLFVIMYQYSYDTDTSTPNGRITKALLDAKLRGAVVKILLEYSSFDSTLNSANQNTSQYLKGKGIDVRLDSKEIVTHAKLLITDDTVVVYSGNWVYSALSANHEVGLITKDSSVRDNAVNYFNALFNSAK